MGLPGRRDRERRRKDNRSINCPSCKTDIEVSVQKRDSIKKVSADDGSIRNLDESFDKTPDDAFTNETSTTCENCNVKLDILKTYSPR